jgi:DNA-binding NarL/FixJ family response regulator
MRKIVDEARKARRERAGETPVEVMVVDDQELWRETLRELVGGTPGLVVVGDASSGEEALEAADRLAPQLVIMDMRMPGIGGIEATRRLTAGHPDAVVVLVSVDGKDAEGLRSCGAAAFVRKEQLSAERLRAAWEAHGTDRPRGRPGSS